MENVLKQKINAQFWNPSMDFFNRINTIVSQKLHLKQKSMPEMINEVGIGPVSRRRRS